MLALARQRWTLQSHRCSRKTVCPAVRVAAHVDHSRLNPLSKLVPYRFHLSAENALKIVEQYHAVLDCTDTPASRYLISDACVLLSKPLVSASALRTEGQLMVLNHPCLPPGESNGGPCYRCVFPTPPPPESVVSCGDGGILGPVVGVMGVLQALEAIKLLTAHPGIAGEATPSPSLLLFSAYSNPCFRSIRLRGRKEDCAVCSTQATVTVASLQSGSLDYIQCCGTLAPVQTLSPKERISPGALAELVDHSTLDHEPLARDPGHIVVDVRDSVQFDLCSLPDSINIPFSSITRTRGANASQETVLSQASSRHQEWAEKLQASPEKPILVVCRLGNDSQLTVKIMKELGLDQDGKRWIGDLEGGLRAWRERIDASFPDY